MSTPTAAFSIRLRARLDNTPGSLGRLAVAIGDAGANICALEGFDVRGDYRRRHAQPLLDELKRWLEDLRPKVLGNTGLCKAINYTLKRIALLHTSQRQKSPLS